MEQQEADVLPATPGLSHMWGITVLTIVFFMAVGISGIGIGTFGNLFMILAELAIIIPALVYLRVSGFPLRKVFRLNAVSWPVAGLSIVLGVALSLAASAVDTMAGSLVPMPEEVRLRLESLLTLNSKYDAVMMVSGLVVAAAVCEELFFRGFIQTTLEQKSGMIPAIALSSLVFGIVHFNPWWFVSILFAGVILGIIAFVTGSIYPGIIIHGVNNGLSLLIVNSGQWEEYKWLGDLETVPLPLAAAAAIVLVLGIVYFHKQKPSDTDTTDEVRHEAQDLR